MSKSRTICFLFASSHIGGAEICALRIIKGLSQSHFKFTAILPNKGPIIKSLLKLNVSVFISSWPHHFTKLSTIECKVLFFRLKRFFNKFPPDLIHNNSMLSLGVAIDIQNKFNIPTFTHWHDNRCPEFQKQLLSKNINTPIVAVCLSVKSVLSKTISNLKNLHVIHNGVDPNIFFPKTKLSTPFLPFKIGFYSRINKEKGLHILIECLNKLPNEIQLDICGHWENNNYKKYIYSLIKKYKLASRIKYFGIQPDMNNIINQCNVVAIASTTEAFPLISLEAMACKKPVLCHKLGGLIEQITHNKNGFFIKTNSITDWVHHILLLFNNQDLYNQMAENALKKSTLFNIKRNITNFSTYYTKHIKV